LREITILHYEETVRLRQNPDWFDGNFIHLPEWAQQKARDEAEGEMGAVIYPW